MATCSVCFNAPVNVMFNVCKHACCCQECVDTLLKTYTPKCPLCMKNLIRDDSGQIYICFFLSGVEEESGESPNKIAKHEPLKSERLVSLWSVNIKSCRKSPIQIEEIADWSVDSENYKFNIKIEAHVYVTIIELKYRYRGHGYFDSELKFLDHGTSSMLQELKFLDLYLRTPILNCPFGITRIIQINTNSIPCFRLRTNFTDTPANLLFINKIRAFDAQVSAYIFNHQTEINKNGKNLFGTDEVYFKEKYFRSSIHSKFNAIFFSFFISEKNLSGKITETTTQITKNNNILKTINDSTLPQNSNIIGSITPKIWVTRHGCGVGWYLHKIEIQ